RCEIIGARGLHPWQPVAAMDGSDLSRAQETPAVIDVGLRNRVIQKHRPEQKEQRQHGRNDVEPYKPCDRSAAVDGGKGLIGCLDQSSGEGDALGLIALKYRFIGGPEESRPVSMQD